MNLYSYFVITYLMELQVIVPVHLVSKLQRYAELLNVFRYHSEEVVNHRSSCDEVLFISSVFSFMHLNSYVMLYKLFTIFFNKVCVFFF
jgi:hypothetical protein